MEVFLLFFKESLKEITREVMPNLALVHDKCHDS